MEPNSLPNHRASPLRTSHLLVFVCACLLHLPAASAEEKRVPTQYRLPSINQFAQLPEPELKRATPHLLPPVVRAQQEQGSVDELQPPQKVIPTPRAIKPKTATADQPLSVQSLLSTVTRAPKFQPGQPVGSDQWWAPHVQHSMRYSSHKFTTGVDQLIQLALENSAQLQVYSEVPRIRATSIIEADAAFDWSQFISGIWDDTSDPVGNVLTVGPGQSRYNDHNLRVDAGLRRKNRYGADIEIAQRFGHQNNNSTFFDPNNQGTSRITFSFTQPLLRGRGEVYNTSLTVLAGIDTQVAREEYERQLESHLLEVARGYWGLYLERGSLTQKAKLYQRTQTIVDFLEQRQHIDAGRTQLISARAALAERRSDLVRASAAVRNAEMRIRGLLNAPALGTTDEVELLPADVPTTEFIPFELYDSVHTAVQYRSEVLQAIKQIKAGTVRLNMAKHEMLPTLNLVTQMYVSGLKGDSDVGAAWVQQFSDGAPSYSIGLEYELPVGRRASSARLQRRQIELRQLNGQYRNALETVKNEVEIAVRELNTAYQEMQTKAQAMQAARQEAEALEARWRQLPNVNTSAALSLEALLRAQERATETEFDFLSAQLTYNLALIQMKRAMGILVTMNCYQAVASTAH